MESMSNLAEKATWGQLTQDEIEHVTRIFYDSKPGQDEHLATCIYISVELCCRHRSAIEKYLYYPTDPDVSATALKVLCLYWKYTDDYLR